MNVGYHIMAWRRQVGLTQSDLAERANLSRPYLSRLEKGKADPTLSCLRRLSQALGLKVGQLIEELPQEQALSRDEIDRLARGALRPGTREAHQHKGTRTLALMNQERRKALGFYIPKKKASTKPGRHSSAVNSGHASGVNSGRWLRASLGEKQWNAILRRIDKLASTGDTET